MSGLGAADLESISIQFITNDLGDFCLTSFQGIKPPLSDIFNQLYAWYNDRPPPLGGIFWILCIHMAMDFF